jgi:hypothetical protein
VPSKDGLSRRQQTISTLFPQRARRPPRPHQLGLGADFVRRPSRCVGCGHELAELELDCSCCGAFLCTECDTMTTSNGGDGRTCYGCMRRASNG